MTDVLSTVHQDLGPLHLESLNRQSLLFISTGIFLLLNNYLL